MSQRDDERPRAAVPKIERSSRLVDEARDAIKQLIITNEFRGGDVISENTLASQLGISRSPVRQALVSLEQEGFLFLEPWRPPRVAPVTRQFVRDVFGVRAPLEARAAADSTAAITDTELDIWDERLSAVAPALEAGDATAFNELETAFHALFVEKSGNKMLVGFLARLEDHLERIRNVYRAEIFEAIESKRLELGEHREILAAVRRRDPRAVERAMADHMDNVAGRLLAVMDEDGGSSQASI
jgi:DNA-binding GntR family transcriptional regulator